MSNNRSELFYAGAAGSTIDPSLPSRHISIPADVSSYNWASIVASNASQWSSQCQGVSFYWNVGETPSIVAVANDPQTSENTLSDAVTYVNNIFANKKLIEHYVTAMNPLPAESKESGLPPAHHHRIHGQHHHGGPYHHQSYHHGHGHPHPHPRHFQMASGRYPNYRHNNHRHNHHHSNNYSAPAAVEEHRIPDDRVGLVIGTKGATIKAIKDVSGANIQINKVSDGSGLRSMSISGSREQIQRAKLEIDRVVKNQSLEATTEDQKVSEMISIPSTVVGTVIGRQGETIRLLQMITHCTILMQKDNDVQVGATSRNIQLLGTEQQIEAAKNHIQKLVEAQTKATLDHPVDANLILTGRASHRSLDIRVNNDIIGMVIGKGGENIRRVNEKSGAKINVDKDLNNNVRIISIVAHTDSSLRLAEQLLRDIILDCNHRKNKTGAFPPHVFPPPGGGLMTNPYPMFSPNPSASGYPPQPMLFIPQTQYGSPGLPPGGGMVQQPHLGAQRNPPPPSLGGGIPTGIAPFSGPTTPGGAGATAEDGIPPHQRTSEDQNLYEYYYNFYLKSYPPEKAAEFAEYYLKNPPTTAPVPK